MEFEAHIITINKNQISQEASKKCIESSAAVRNRFDIQVFDAITPSTLPNVLNKEKIKWNYPWNKPEIDIKSGLTKNPYVTANPHARIACAMSHYMLWKKCAYNPFNFLILEHDAFFIRKLDYRMIDDSPCSIVGINDPTGATPRYRDYIRLANKANTDGKKEIVLTPYVNKPDVPQGLAGNSAYIITPNGAKKMLQLVQNYGLWPNDALMCRQLFPDLGVSTTYYTRIQGSKSTTVN